MEIRTFLFNNDNKSYLQINQASNKNEIWQTYFNFNIIRIDTEVDREIERFCS